MGFSEDASSLTEPWKLLFALGTQPEGSPGDEGMLEGLKCGRPTSLEVPRGLRCCICVDTYVLGPKPLGLEATSDLPQDEWKIPGVKSQACLGRRERPGLV